MIMFIIRQVDPQEIVCKGDYICDHQPTNIGELTPVKKRVVGLKASDLQGFIFRVNMDIETITEEAMCGVKLLEHSEDCIRTKSTSSTGYCTCGVTDVTTFFENITS